MVQLNAGRDPIRRKIFRRLMNRLLINLFLRKTGMTILAYKPQIMPPELRVSIVGWNCLLAEWEQQALFLLKKDFFRRGVEYVSLRGYLNNRVDEQIKLHRYEEFVYDNLSFPPKNEHDRIEGERRLMEYRERIKKLVEISRINLEYDDISLMRDSLRYPPASEMDIQLVESRLGVRLPPSYREFLSISNGWLIENNPSLLPVEKVGLLREIDSKYVQEYLEDEYLLETTEFVVTSEPLGEGESFVTRNLDVPTACLNDAIAIGVDDREKAFLLLDPTTVDDRGEWRAFWLFRYEFAIVGRDFARLMEILYRLNAQRIPA
jgi:hypothetical protein